jgi:hypothetical protein
MIELQTSRFKLPPYPHQLAGVKTLLKKKVYGLFWEMRLGKTKCIIDTACTLFDADQLDVVVIECPAQVKDVWIDEDLGEISKHAFSLYHLWNYDSRREFAVPNFMLPTFIVTSFEFLRQENAHGEFPKVDALIEALKGKRVWHVIDEASAIANHKALQTKATYKLRQACERVTELDGTPAGNSPMDLFAKFMVLDKEILGYKSFWEFSRNHTVSRKVTLKGRKPFNKVIGYQNLEYITDRTKPFCEYLKQTDALEMPEKVRTFFTVPLSTATWKVYRQLRDELIAELDTGTVLLKNSAAKVTRLAQLCAGFLGGIESSDSEPSSIPDTQELSSETTDAFVAWLKERLTENPNFKCVVWARWRPEIERLHSRLLKEFFYTVKIGLCYGGHKDENFLHPDSGLDTAAVMIAQVQAARFGNNYSKADTVVYLSQGYDLVSRSQSEDRVQAPNGRKTTLMIDVIVTGPDGQKTITHDVAKTLATKESIATRTTNEWRKVLSE